MRETIITKYEDVKSYLTTNNKIHFRGKTRPEFLVFKGIQFEECLQINEIEAYTGMQDEKEFSLIFEDCEFKKGLEVSFDEKKDFKFKKFSLKSKSDNVKLDSEFSGSLKLNFFSADKFEVKNYNFDEIEIRNIDFEEDSKVLFENLKVNKFTMERVSQNAKYMQFHNIKIIRKLIFKRIEFTNTYFNDFDIQQASITIDKVSFINAHLNSVKWGVISRIKAKKDIFRQLKFVNDQNGNYIDGNKFYVQEMQVHREELRKDKSRYLDRFTFFLNKELSNYGQSWLIALCWIVIISYGLLLIHEEAFSFFNTFISIVFLTILLSLMIIRIVQPIKDSFLQIVLYVGLASYLLSIYSISDLEFRDVFHLVVPKPIEEYKTIWGLHKVLIAFPLYHFTISLRRLTRR